MKKYQEYTKQELLSVIQQKNKTIQKLNGQVYYYKKNKSYYKDAQKKYYNKLNELERLNNGK